MVKMVRIRAIWTLECSIGIFLIYYTYSTLKVYNQVTWLLFKLYFNLATDVWLIFVDVLLWLFSDILVVPYLIKYVLSNLNISLIRQYHTRPCHWFFNYFSTLVKKDFSIQILDPIQFTTLICVSWSQIWIYSYIALCVGFKNKCKMALHLI
jgi:hypothetical protein